MKKVEVFMFALFCLILFKIHLFLSTFCNFAEGGHFLGVLSLYFLLENTLRRPI